MAKIEGVEAVKNALRKVAKEMEGVSVVVGFEANYAIHVHEDMEAFHRVGQAKFLEQPARECAQEIGETVVKAVKNGASVEQSLLIGGLRLQREAQLLTPVDTGNLKASAFTEVEDK